MNSVVMLLFVLSQTCCKAGTESHGSASADSRVACRNYLLKGDLMKKKAILITIILVVLGCVPAMAQMVELADSDLELITGQASDIGVPQTFENADASQIRYNFELGALDMDSVIQNLQGTEFELPRTTISIESISTSTPFGAIDVRGINVDMEAGTTVRFF